MFLCGRPFQCGNPWQQHWGLAASVHCVVSCFLVYVPVLCPPVSFLFCLVDFVHVVLLDMCFYIVLDEWVLGFTDTPILGLEMIIVYNLMA